ncbi:unnamed protein product [Prunus armeniaca]|uniref:Uncharacterized protein n=1 Tax=Prunus armeniaca TaxID=36596 RepID=A0A6J5UF93_PRUAR|nr:unnamed protein product [Prunus armeniaca]
MDFKAMLLLFASVLLVSAEDRYVRYGSFRKGNPVFRAPPSPRQMNEAAPTGVPVAMPFTAPQVKTNREMAFQNQKVAAIMVIWVAIACLMLAVDQPQLALLKLLLAHVQHKLISLHQFRRF